MELREAYDENASTKAEANEAQGQPLAAQANIGGSNHSASVGDSYYSPGPRNGFIELHVLTMGLADFMVRLEKVEGVKEVTLMDKVKLMSSGWGWGHQQCLQVLYYTHPNNPVEFGLHHWWRTYRCACRPALGSPHRYVCTRVCTHGMCIVVCFYAMCKNPTRGDYTNKDPGGAWVSMIAAFYNCPRAPGLLEMSFRVLYDAVHDVAFNPERHALSSQSQPLAASSSSIPAGGEEDAPTENFEMSWWESNMAYGS